MKRENIEKLLKDNGVAEDKIKAAVDTVMDENGKDIETEKAKTTAKDGELTTANQTIKNLNETVKKFDGVDPKKLQEDAAALQVKYDVDIASEKKKAGDIVKEYALKDALKASGVLDPDYLIFKHGGIEKFAFSDDNKPVGVDDTIKPYKESAPQLFVAEDQKGKVIVSSAAEHKPGGGETTPETLRGALAEAYKK